MSFKIDWDKIQKGDEAQKLKDYLNARFRDVKRPDSLGEIVVDDLDFGDIPPEITLVDITDPWPVFYDTETGSESIDWNDENMHAQVEISIVYAGNMRASIKTQLIVNQPTPRFAVLPLTLKLTAFSINATAMAVYLGDSFIFCLKQPPPDTLLLPTLSFESEVGDANVLKNVSRIDKFIETQIRKFFDDYLVYPNYHSIILQPEVDELPLDSLSDFSSVSRH